VAEVAAYCDDDAVYVVDGGDYVSFAGRLVERSQPGLWLDPGPFGCLGSGVGYALAAKLAHPDRQVVLLSGDGAFGFSGLDFDTLLRHQVPVVCVVGNNGIWATEKHPMQAALQTAIAADLRPGTRYDRVVEALGGHGELVERPEQLRGALDRAFRSGVAACVNVITDATAEYPRSTVLM
jgi:acetolactate synthase-1/2/3 large subunit